MALGVPTLTVFRECGGLQEWAPAGKGHHYLTAPCRCISENRDDCRIAEKSSCLAGISPERMVEQALRQLR
jgi:hypothetical protein